MAEIRLDGHLAKRARCSVDPADGTAWLVLEVSQGARSVCAAARWRMGQGLAAQHACSRAAARMAKGTRVSIRAGGWELDRKAEQLVLVAVKDVTQFDIPAPLGAQPEKETA